MRTPLVLLIGLLLLGAWLGHCDGESDLSVTPPRHAADEAPWVRTVNGWERAVWLVPQTVHRPLLHPLLVALFVGLSSTIGLLTFADAKSRAEV